MMIYGQILVPPGDFSPAVRMTVKTEAAVKQGIGFAHPDLSSGSCSSKPFRRCLKSSLGGLGEDSVNSRENFLGPENH